MNAPPPIIDGAQVLEYAIVDDTVKFTGRLHLYVGNERLGAVPRLAICETLPNGELLLFHCDNYWNVLGIQIWNAPDALSITTVKEVRLLAEHIYAGISSKWICVSEYQKGDNEQM